MAKKKKSQASTDLNAAPPPPAEPAPKPVTDAKFIWPPFPTPPEGVKLIPFGEFQPKGIVINLEGGVEKDGEGIPTIALLVKHGTKKLSKSRKKKDPLSELTEEELRKLTWDKKWELGEEMRSGQAIDSSLSLEDQFRESTNLFRQNRPWDHTRQELWDQWRVYSGILTGVKKPFGKKPQYDIDDERPNAEDPGIDEDISDEDIDDGGKNAIGDESEPILEEQAVRIAGSPEKRDRNWEKHEALLAAAEERMPFWVNETEKATKIFFSSHFRDKGLMLSKQNTRDGPLLLRFYFNFVLRNNLIIDKHLVRNYQKALKIVERATDELPYTFTMSKVLPDDFGRGCAALWGVIYEMKFGVRRNSELVDQPIASKDAATDIVDDGDKSQDSDRLARLVSVEHDMGDTLILEQGRKKPHDVGEEPAPEAMIEEVHEDGPKVDMVEEREEGDKERDDDAEGDKWKITEESGGWGGWGNSTESEDLTKRWGTPEGEEDEWGPFIVQSIFPYVGPTSIPHHYIPIRAEYSTRVLVDVKQPDPNSPDPLASCLAILVLQPWPTPDDDPDSLVRSPKTLEFGENDEQVMAARRVARKHEPAQDDIKVYVDPSVIPECKVGMGIGASWVQAGRIPDANETKPRKRSKSDEWWYMEHLGFIVPGFWTPNEESRDMTRKQNNPEYAYEWSD